MFTELSLGNFKSWEKIENIRLAPITGLFGTNSSGKSSIIQLLLMLKQTIESSDRAQVLEFGDDKNLTNLGSFRDVVYRHEKPGSIRFSLRWTLNKPLMVQDPESRVDALFTADQLAFKCELGENGGDRLAVSKFEYSADKNRFVLQRKGLSAAKYALSNEGDGIHFTRALGRAWDLPAPVKFYGFPDQVYAYYQNAGFLSDLQLAFENVFRGLYYLGPLREFPQRHYPWKGSEPGDMGRRGERVVDALLASRQNGAYISPGYRKKKQTLEQRVAYWLKELGLIHDFKVQRIAEGNNLYEVRVKKTQASTDVLITDVGFGVSQVLPVLVLCYYVPEGSVILLEQPEIHLHPSVQSTLADVFIDVVRNRKVQIIVESHSEHLLRRFQRRVADETLKPDDTAFYFSEIGDAGSKLTTLEVDLFGRIKNWPKDFFGDEFGEMAEITRAAMLRKKAQ